MIRARKVKVSLALAALAAAGAIAGCSSSRTIIPYAPEGKPVPFVYRHDMRAKDAETREPVANALVAVKTSDDAVWQVDWTGPNGGAALSQEYAEATVYNDQRFIFFVQTDNQIVLRAPAFQMTVRHPGYSILDKGYGGNAFLDRPRDMPGFSYAELVRPILIPLEREEGAVGEAGPLAPPGDRVPAPATPAAVVRPTLAALTALSGPELLGTREGPAMAGFSFGPAVHGGRFVRTTGASGLPERAMKLYQRPEDRTFVFVASFAPGDAEAPARRVVAVADTADVVLYGDGAGRFEAPPSRRFVRADRGASLPAENRLGVAFAALTAAIESGAHIVATYYPLELAPAIADRLGEARFELLAEWWLPFEKQGTE